MYTVTYEAKAPVLTAADTALVAKDPDKMPLDVDLTSLSHVVRATSTTTVGLLLVIPHHVTTDVADELVLPGASPMVKRVALCTHLHVDAKHPKLVGPLMETAARHARIEKIDGGYYVLPHAGTNTIPIKTWYRPLKVEAALACGYTLPTPTVLTQVGSTTKSLAAAVVEKVFYTLSGTHATRPTIATDFAALTRRSLSVHIDATEFKRLNVKPLHWLTATSNDTVLGVCAYRSFTRGGKQSAQLCYIEVASTLTGADASPISVVTSLLAALESKGYTSVHGVEVGPLVAIADELRLVRTAIHHLHTIHLTLPPDASTVSLLYL